MKLPKITINLSNKRFVAIDPASGASSMPGFAVYENGSLVSSGTLSINSDFPIQYRLQQLAAECRNLGVFDILVIERIRGKMSHESLKWAVGTIIASVQADGLIEMPITTWQKYAPKDWVKGDESDAIAIGHAVLHITQGNK